MTRMYKNVSYTFVETTSSIQSWLFYKRKATKSITKIFKHRFDGDWALGDLNVNIKRFTIWTLESDIGHDDLNMKTNKLVTR